MVNIRIIGFFLIGTLFFFLLLRSLGGPLITPSAGYGIVSLELAHGSAVISDILNDWDKAGLRDAARTNILVDFLFIPCYTLLFYSLCGSISVRLKGTASKTGILLAFGSLIAGVLDCGENILMLLSLQGIYNGASAFMTAVFAYTKFFLLLMALLYIIPMGIKLATGKLKH
jgi:hypothetical protein